MALKLHILGGGQLPQGDRRSKPECEKILSIVWNDDMETMVKGFLSLIDETVEEETPGWPLSRDTVRTKVFTESFKAKVLAARPKAAAIDGQNRNIDRGTGA
jgi:hypothetical protein